MWAGILRASNLAKATARSPIGRDFRRGVGEMLGQYYAKDAGGILRNTGFLGRKAASMGIKPLGSFGKAMTGLGLAFVGASAIQGYREEGAWGAAKGGYRTSKASPPTGPAHR